MRSLSILYIVQIFTVPYKFQMGCIDTSKTQQACTTPQQACNTLSSKKKSQSHSKHLMWNTKKKDTLAKKTRRCEDIAYTINEFQKSIHAIHCKHTRLNQHIITTDWESTHQKKNEQIQSQAIHVNDAFEAHDEHKKTLYSRYTPRRSSKHNIDEASTLETIKELHKLCTILAKKT